ncbi:MAG: FliA/WhiG family RNA polymerase sigma factor [Vicinamibacterales bacterium]
MRSNTVTHTPRIVATLPFVEQLARRVAATMPHSIDIGDLVQDGVLGLIDAANRYDEARGIKFETFAERRIRGAMIDALRKDAWPRGVRRQRRELEAAREELRRELGCEPSLADLAARMGSDEKRLGRTIVRIKAIESTSPLANNENLSEASLPAALIPSEPEAPDAAFEREETSDRVRAAIESLPPREQKVIGLYYYQEATMKQIGAEIGVNESRVSQLHARAIRRLKDALHSSMSPGDALATTASVLAFYRKPQTEATAPSRHLTLVNPAAKAPAVVVTHPSVNRQNSDAVAGAKRLAAGRKRTAMVSSVAKMPRRPADVIAIAR